MDYNIYEEDFLKKWIAIDFDSWNESDIREDFIAPLLKLLGYEKNSVNNIVREKSLKLEQAYHRIGRDKIRIDYVPTIRLRSFWIIEAKPGNQTELYFGDFAQAYLYATHSEVNAPFIVLTNGREIKIFETSLTNSWEKPLIVCNQENCRGTFSEVIKCLNSKTMFEYIRKRIISLVEDSFSVELDEKQVDSFRYSVNRTINEMKKVVKDNAREYQVEYHRRSELERKRMIKEVDISSLLIAMDNPVNFRTEIPQAYYDRLLLLGIEERTKAVEKLVQKTRFRPHSVFLVLGVYILQALMINKVEVNKSIYFHSIKDEYESLVLNNIHYWKSSTLSHLLRILNNTTNRIAAKMSKKYSMKSIIDMIKAQKKSLSIEELLSKRPTVSGTMVEQIRLVAEILWRACSRSSAIDVFYNIAWLHSIEALLECVPTESYPKGEADLL